MRPVRADRNSIHTPAWRLPHAAAALLAGALLVSLGACGGEPPEEDVQATTEAATAATRLVASTCGTWDAKGVHATGHYFVGHSNERRSETVSYFVFNLRAIKGKTVSAASVTIPGTSDWTFTGNWTGHTPLHQFKVGMTPLPGSLTVGHVTGGANDPAVYHDVRNEQNLGYGWTPDGGARHSYDSFHYDPGRFQAAVNGGGLLAMFAVSRFGTDLTSEQYIFGGGTCGSGITLNVTTR